MKKIFVAMIVIVVMLVSGLTFIGFQLQRRNRDFYDLEKKLVEAAEIYLGMHPEKFHNRTTSVTAVELINQNFLEDMNIDEETCLGYVIINSRPMRVPEYKAFIKCENYTTKKFDETQIKSQEPSGSDEIDS